MKKFALGIAAVAFAASSVLAAETTWKKITLTEKFYAEGAHYADFNKDGVMDVVSGPFWYQGPDFKTKHQIYKPEGKHEEGSWKADGEYSDNFLCYTADFNLDGLPDYLVYGFPGKDARVYLNPGKPGELWKLVQPFDVVDNESPQFADMDGDGKPEGIFHTSSVKNLPDDGKKGGCLGYAVIDWKDPLKPWTYKAISPKGGWQRFTHGYGFGDVNGDGKNDILDSKSWWEQPADPNAKEWIRHPYNFYAKNKAGQTFGDGGAQMFVYDVDGDGLNDVITSLQAHGCGLAWFKQKKVDGKIDFDRMEIMPADYVDNAQGVKFSQLHAVTLADMNGDGLMDIVTGKRYFAHHSKGDVAPLDPPVLYWFELKRDKDKGVQWIAHKMDDASGVGTQVTAGDINGDKIPDVVVGSKRGAFVFLSEKK